MYFDDKYDRYYITMTKERQGQFLNPKYVIGAFQSNTVKVYLSPKQLEIVDNVADEIYAERAGRLVNALHDYFSATNCYESLYYLEGKRDVPLHTLQKVQEEIGSAYQKSLDELVPHKTNENVVLWQWAEDKPVYYITKSSVEGFKALLTQIDEKIAKLKAEEEARIAEEKAREEERLARLKAEEEAKIAKLSKCLDFIIREKKASNVTYDTEFNNYFTYDNRTEYWRLDASNILKPFCPMHSYEILGITDSSIKCRLMKAGKKKSLIIYEIELEYYYDRLRIESFDINKAKLIEE